MACKRARILMVLLASLAAACSEQPAPADGSGPATGGQRPRIVTLAPHLTELVFAAGAGGQLVGVVEYSDYPAAALALPRVGDAFRVDFETLATLAPDLVLGWPSGNSSGLLEHLRHLGYRVESLEPGGLDGIAAQIEVIGALAGTPAAAAAAAAAVRTELARLREAQAGASAVRVFYQVASRPLLTVNRRHIISEAMAVCGGTNVFADLPELAPSISAEAVIAARPEAIVATWHGPPGVSPPAAEEVLADWLRWTVLPAVGKGNLFLIDADLLSRATPRMLRGVEELCLALDQARARLH